MKRYAFVLALALCACNPNKTLVDANFHPTQRGWSPTPIWSDEFNGNALDPSKWVTAKFCLGFNNEQQCYTDLPQNVSVSNGHLVIRARPDNCSGASALAAAASNEVGWATCNPGPPFPNYSSGRLHTRVTPGSSGQHSWKYGRVEIRAKLPYGDGTWPAFWMMPQANTYGGWPESGEIDIMETASLHSPTQTGDRVEANVHLCSKSGYTPNPPPPGTNPHTCQDLRTAKADNGYEQVYYPRKLYMAPDGNCWPDLSKRFHTYSMEWSNNDLRFFLDDKLIGTHILHGSDEHNVAPFQHPFYLIINLAIGGDMVPNNLVDPNTWMPTTPRTAELVVDWVRVYECSTDVATARGCIYNGNGLGRKPPAVTQVTECTSGWLPD